MDGSMRNGRQDFSATPSKSIKDDIGQLSSFETESLSAASCECYVAVIPFFPYWNNIWPISLNVASFDERSEVWSESRDKFVKGDRTLSSLLHRVDYQMNTREHKTCSRHTASSLDNATALITDKNLLRENPHGKATCNWRPTSSRQIRCLLCDQSTTATCKAVVWLL